MARYRATIFLVLAVPPGHKRQRLLRPLGVVAQTRYGYGSKGLRNGEFGLAVLAQEISGVVAEARVLRTHTVRLLSYSWRMGIDGRIEPCVADIIDMRVRVVIYCHVAKALEGNQLPAGCARG